MAESNPLRPALFHFMRELAADNCREWFLGHAERYERDVRGPAMAFITALRPHLAAISPQILAEPRKAGGALLRIQRDRRFQPDAAPYKEWVGLQFRHAASGPARAGVVQAPSFYLHLEPGRCYASMGLARPDAATAGAVRTAIVADPAAWRRAVGGRRFRAAFALEGRSLKRFPAGLGVDHPLAEDLCRVDFTAVARLSQRQVTAPGFVREFAGLCRASAPLVRFLCAALDQPF